jgi:hypothetical protein
LEEEDLVPAARIHVSWKSSKTYNTVGGFLRADLFHANNNVASFPEAKPIVQEKASSNSSGNANNGNSQQSKEELLMARMMGKGLLGGKKSSGGSEHGEKKGKPKWFK